jgi:hypothetical protein
MMGLVIFLRGNFGAILESWSWLTVTVAVFGLVRRHIPFIYSSRSMLQIVFYVFAHAIYNIYFHPLAKFPGPKLAVVSNIFYARTVVSGNSVKIMTALHEKYGPFPKPKLQPYTT